MEPYVHGQYVLLSNIYAQANRREDFANVRKGMSGKSIQWVPDRSSIEVGDMVSSSLVTSHTPAMKIYKLLEEMIDWLKEVRYRPNDFTGSAKC